MRRRVRDLAWSGLVPVVWLLAGLLFSTTAETARGTDLRADRRPDLAGLIADSERRIASSTSRLTTLEGQLDAQDRLAAKNDDRVATARRQAAALALPVGLLAMRGAALTVTLDDAPRRADGTLPPNARNADDVVVHQQDVQAVVNALWAGGADAMTIQGQRLTSTSAVKCVGNTLLLYGRVYSPPFRIAAIGDPSRLRRALDRSGGVQEYLRAVDYFGLGYQVTEEAALTMPGYDGPIRLGVAKPAREN